MIMNNRVWLAPFLLPIAVGACSAPVDENPFRQGAAANSAGAPAQTNQTPSDPPAADGASTPPTPPGGESEASADLPVTPPEPSNASDSPDEAPDDPSNSVPPAPEPSPDAPALCASYQAEFLPLVHEPVCSRCHTSGRGLPQFEPFAQAEARCAQIGRLVAAGEMPPGGGLSADQRAIVASWVSLDCPETAEQAAAVCVPSRAPAPDPTPPGPGGDGAADDDDDDDDGDEDDDDDDDDESDDDD